MRKILLAVCLISLTSSSYAQREVKSFVRENFAALASINPEDSNYQGFAEIAKAIGDKQIVLKDGSTIPFLSPL